MIPGAFCPHPVNLELGESFHMRFDLAAGNPSL